MYKHSIYACYLEVHSIDQDLTKEDIDIKDSR